MGNKEILLGLLLTEIANSAIQLKSIRDNKNISTKDAETLTEIITKLEVSHKVLKAIEK